MRVVIIGQGYVGLPLAISAAKAGHDVSGIDLNKDLVAKLNLGSSPIVDVPDSEIKEVIRSGRYKAFNDTEVISSAEITVVCVPTPLTDVHEPDLSFVSSAVKSIAEKISLDSLVIIESTVAPGTTRGFIADLLNKSGKSYDLAYSPERIDPSNQNWKITNTPKLVAGLTPSATARATDFYSTFIKNVIAGSSLEVIETAKLLENSFRLINISFINEFADFCHKIKIDVREVIEAASTKPYGFMKFYPSAGIGGHCIPVDPIYLATAAKEIGVSTKFIDLANYINLSRPKFFLEIAQEILGTIQGKNILVVGVAYKPNVSDTRETPALSLIHLLRGAGANVRWNDDLVQEWEGESSVAITSEYDLAILVNPHSDTDLSALGTVKILDTHGGY
jgi:UDP-N-acetyl-D-glucosamine dehydrogenase